MNIKKLFECLTEEEKTEMFSLLKNDPIFIDRELNSVSKFLEKYSANSTMSRRLYNNLTMGIKHHGWGLLSVKELTLEKFTYQRNAGKKSWEEFVEMRGY